MLCAVQMAVGLETFTYGSLGLKKKMTTLNCFCLYCKCNRMYFNQFFNVGNLVISQALSQTTNYSGNHWKPTGGANLSAFRFMRNKGFWYIHWRLLKLKWKSMCVCVPRRATQAANGVISTVFFTHFHTTE